MTTVVRRGLAPVRDVLSNGATVLVKENRTTPAATINVTVAAGSAFEPVTAPGLAHFLSRVLDRGTARWSADEIAEALDARGVSLHVGVSRHTMSLICSCLAEDFEAMLDLVGDVARAAGCPAEEVEKRRGEVITAIRQDQDSPAVLAVECLMGILYGTAHPYGRPIKGNLESVERISRDDLVAFHAARFAPSRVTIALVGDFETSQAIATARRAFGGWDADPAPAPLWSAPPAARSRTRMTLPMMNKAQADIAYGWVSIRREDARYHAFSIMNNVLGQYSLGGRLGDNIRERQGMAYYVFSSFDAGVLEGPLVIRAGVGPAHVDRAIDAVDAEVARIASEGISDQELADSKRYLIGSIPRMLETNAGIANFLQAIEQFGLGLDYDVRLPDLLSAVTPAEVFEAARTLSPQDASIVVAGPYAGASR